MNNLFTAEIEADQYRLLESSIKFVKELDSYYVMSTNPIDKDILDIIGNCFGYTESSFYCYAPNEAKDVFFHSSDVNSSFSRNEYYINDPSGYDIFLQRTYEINKKVQPGKYAVIDSTNILDENEDQKYTSFLSNIGLCPGSLSILFNDRNITLYQPISYEGFSSDQRDEIVYIAELISNIIPTERNKFHMPYGDEFFLLDNYYDLILTNSNKNTNKSYDFDEHLKITRESSRNYCNMLTPRENEIVQAIASGKTYPAIAEMLSISVPTVKTHISNVYKKTGINNQLDLLRWWHDQTDITSK